MSRARFTLTVATSSDALISPSSDISTASWASAEEQALFFAEVSASDWCVMGRKTHEAADKPERRRIIFSTTRKGWQRPTQLWLDPDGLGPEDLIAAVAGVRPLERGLILGGTAVHDWFLAHNAIESVNLTVEPVLFGSGVPVFSGQKENDPLKVFTARGFGVSSARDLNERGTRFHTLHRLTQK